MVDKLIIHGLQYSSYCLELGLFLYLLFWGQWRRLIGLGLYVLLFLATDAIGRPFVLYRYGLASHEYRYAYWLTDVLLTLSAFLLVCSFFRRACVREEKMWRFLRLLLVFVFVIVLGISYLSLSRNYDQLFTRFIFEFQQNLYFTCLVLNTLLFIMMQQIDPADDELGLLVCGMGIQYAGPAANFALLHLTPGRQYAGSLLTYVVPLCTLGMFLTWFYAVVRMPKPATVTATSKQVRGLADVAVHQT